MKEKLVDRRTGIIKDLVREKHIVGMIPMYMTIAFRNAVRDDELNIVVPVISNGLGADFFSIEKTEKAAIGEIIERYSSTFLESEILYGSYKDLKINKNVLNPSDVTRFSDEQVKNLNLNSVKINDDTKFYWTKGIELNERKETWVPTDLVYLTPSFNNKYPIRDIVSTGLATGSSIEDATVRGLLECIERDAVVIMWQNKIPFPIVDLLSIKNKKITDVIKIIKSMNLQITILDITTDINVPTYFTIIKNNRVPYLSVGASCDFNPVTALYKSITEAAALYNLSVKRKVDNQLYHNPDTPIDNMEAHSDYFALNQIELMNENLSFLFEGKIIDFKEMNPKIINNYSDLIKRLDELEINTYSIDLTTSDIRSVGLHVVRVVAPRLAFLEISIPLLNCDRIYTVPNKIGYSTPNSLNSVIHPFP